MCKYILSLASTAFLLLGCTAKCEQQPGSVSLKVDPNNHVSVGPTFMMHPVADTSLHDSVHIDIWTMDSARTLDSSVDLFRKSHCDMLSMWLKSRKDGVTTYRVRTLGNNIWAQTNCSTYSFTAADSALVTVTDSTLKIEWSKTVCPEKSTTSSNNSSDHHHIDWD